jgi:hypothetical protein
LNFDDSPGLAAMETSKETSKDAKAKPLKTDASATEKMGLEEIVRMANKIGLEYADAKKLLDRLELMKPTVRARISLRIDSEKMSETQLRRLTETDSEYVEYLEQMIEARHACDKLRIRYDSYKNLFDAKRSMLSYQKAELKLL